jgi:hypothetical protein
MLENFKFLDIFQNRKKSKLTHTIQSIEEYNLHISEKIEENENEVEEEDGEEVEEEHDEEVENIKEEEEVEENETNIFESHINHASKIILSELRYFVKMRVKYLLYGIEKNILLYNNDNRLISEERLKHFRNFDIVKSDPIILGKYYDEECSSYVYDIIDGQHRVQAMRRFMNDINEGKLSNKNKHWNVFLEIYHVSSINDSVVFELFKIANNNLNMTDEDDVTQLLMTQY